MIFAIVFLVFVVIACAVSGIYLYRAANAWSASKIAAQAAEAYERQERADEASAAWLAAYLERYHDC